MIHTFNQNNQIFGWGNQFEIKEFNALTIYFGRSLSGRAICAIFFSFHFKKGCRCYR